MRSSGTRGRSLIKTAPAVVVGLFLEQPVLEPLSARLVNHGLCIVVSLLRSDLSNGEDRNRKGVALPVLHALLDQLSRQGLERVPSWKSELAVSRRR